MTQTPQPPRDWQKDMAFILREKKRVQIFHLDTKEEDIAIHWIQEAKRLQESFDIAHMAYEGLQNDCVSRGEYESMLNKLTVMTKAQQAEKARADEWRERTRQVNMELEAAEASRDKAYNMIGHKAQEISELREALTAAEAREQHAIREIRRRIDEIKGSGYTKQLLMDLLATLYPDTPAELEDRGTGKWDTARPIDEWHEDIGPVLWWTFPIEELPYCGSPLDVDWPGYHTHWTPFIIPFTPEPKEGE